MEKTIQSMIISRPRETVKKQLDDKDFPKPERQSSPLGVKQRLKRIVSDRKGMPTDTSIDRTSEKTLRKKTEKSCSIYLPELIEKFQGSSSGRPSKKNIFSINKPKSKSKRRCKVLTTNLSYHEKKAIKNIHPNKNEKIINSSISLQSNIPKALLLDNNILKRMLSPMSPSRLTDSSSQHLLRPNSKKSASRSGFIKTNRHISPKHFR